jgi:hypothetical protein
MQHFSVWRFPDRLDIIIPAKPSILAMVWLGAWLVGWAFGETLAFWVLVRGGGNMPVLFLLVWLGGWTLGGAFGIHSWLWTAVGKEIVCLRAESLVVRRTVFRLGKAHEYNLSDVTKLRVSLAALEPYGWGARGRFWGMAGTGAVAFDYRGKTFRFGDPLDEAEASQIIRELRARHVFA